MDAQWWRANVSSCQCNCYAIICRRNKAISRVWRSPLLDRIEIDHRVKLNLSVYVYRPSSHCCFLIRPINSKYSILQFFAVPFLMRSIQFYGCILSMWIHNPDFAYQFLIEFSPDNCWKLSISSTWPQRTEELRSSSDFNLHEYVIESDSNSPYSFVTCIVFSLLMQLLCASVASAVRYAATAVACIFHPTKPPCECEVEITNLFSNKIKMFSKRKQFCGL